MQTATIDPQIVKRIMEGAVLMGHQAEDILKSYGIPVQVLTNPKLRIPCGKFSELTEGLWELLADEAYGMLEKPMPAGSWALLSKACLSGSNLEESLRTWADGCNLMNHSISAEFRRDEQGGTLIINCQKKAGITGNAIVECVLMGLHRFNCWLAGELIPIEQIELSYPKPDFAKEFWFAFFGAPVLFNRKVNAITFSNESLNLECRRDKRALEDWLDAPHFNALVESVRYASLGVRLRLWMEKVLQEGVDKIQLESAACHFGISPQSLWRSLKEEGFSYASLKEEVRRDVAIHLLKSRDISVEEVAYRVGYSEASTFIRAFKRWTGRTPLTYRSL